jgi:hypothetical protein
MAVHGGPKIATSGLVLSLDAANSKGFDSYENLLTNSDLGQQVTGSGGTGYSVSTDNTVVNPFGTSGATKIVVSSSGSGYTRQGGSFTFTAGVTYTFSCFFKNESVNLSNITNSTYGSTFGIVIQSFSPTYDAVEGYFNLVPTTSYSNGWLRKSYTFTATYSQTYACSFSSSPNSPAVGTYYLYGFQLETGSTASTYYPTTASTKTRGSTLIDLSGRGNTGTLTNGPTYSSANGGSLVFDGVDDYINMGNSQAGNFGTSNFSINAFFRCTLGSNNAGIFCKSIGNNPTTEYGWLLDTPSGTQLGFAIATTNSAWGSSGSYSCQSTGLSINDGNWRMATIVGDRTQTNISMYINGVLQTLQGFAGGLNQFNTVGNVTNTYNLVLGSESDAGAEQLPFTGNIAQASIYNRALTASEVSQNFNALRGRYGV